MNYDVVIVGGGPAGSTAGTLLRKYAPDLSVLILEREQFPRDHVGESQLPVVSAVLDEMGCWDKVEAAGFPIKIGATYRWGKSPELWDFEFYPSKLFTDEPRPAKYEGQRRYTAFQVDRAIYDKILLDHTAECGCEVRQGARVVKVATEGDRVDHLELDSGETVRGRFTIDASGHSGIVRRAVGVGVHSPTSLQNIAIWDYWTNAKWALEIGTGATRVLVLSVPYGWIWFIPLGPTRTSVGLVVPVEKFREMGLKPSELYAQALRDESRIAELMVEAVSEGNLSTTRDWSFLADQQIGPNWILAGESQGFADPILAAGLSLAQVGAKEAAITVIELLKGRHDGGWLRDEYQQRQTSRIRSHIRFADYWYTANAQFSDLQEFTQTIAKESGLDLSPERAWAWLAQGGFIDPDANVGTGGFPIDHLKELGEFLFDLAPTELFTKFNVFQLNLAGASWATRAQYVNGEVRRVDSYVRDGKTLPLIGEVELTVDILQRASTIVEIRALVKQIAEKHLDDRRFIDNVIGRIPHVMEGMLTDGWLMARYDGSLPLLGLPERKSPAIHANDDLGR